DIWGRGRERWLALGVKLCEAIPNQQRSEAMAGQLIVGLDVSSRARAEEIVALLGDAVDFYKIGYQCFYGADGLSLGRALLGAGKKVFFDLKLLDIDNTVEKGVA